MALSGLLERASAYARLGPRSLARVGLYRLGLRAGLHPVLRIASAPIDGPFFGSPILRDTEKLTRPSRWLTTQPAFFAHEFPLGDTPAWNASPFEPDRVLGAEAEWHRFGDFDTGVIDIKTVWEASRWDWVPAMAQRATLGDESELERLNNWLSDWQKECPPYRGPNWKCGQEASIRVMQLALGALVMRQESKPLPALLALVHQHCRRIAPTMGYARGQDNNHGTSEAAALFVGGNWLAAHGHSEGARWADLGRKALEERCLALIARDGTFSQYSVTYHRILLETVCLAETWRMRLGLASFGAAFLERLATATHWLRQFVDDTTGDAPNIGANDGAMLFSLGDAHFRDFRPVVQWASALFRGECAYSGHGSWNDPLQWLDLSLPASLAEPLVSETLDDGGFHILRAGKWRAYLRYPRFRFRPSQADALHCDLWYEARNIVRDAGTFSYAAEGGAAFASTAYHSTVEFDGRDQMPKISRFLYGRWLLTTDREPVQESVQGAKASAAYRDGFGARHARSVALTASGLTCSDRLDGSFRRAVLRWRLEPGQWTIDGAKAWGKDITIEWTAMGCSAEAKLVHASESRYYLHKSDIPVLEISVTGPCNLVTRISER